MSMFNWTEREENLQRDAAQGLENTQNKFAKKAGKEAKFQKKESGRKEGLATGAYQQGRSDVQQAQNSQIAQRQNQYLDMLQQRASGQAPSLAEAQMKTAQDRNLAQQVAAITAQRGGNNAATQRMMMQGQAQQGQALAGQAAQARLQEMNEAQGMYGNAVQGARGQDLQITDMLQRQAMQRQAEQTNLQSQADQMRQAQIDRQAQLRTGAAQTNLQQRAADLQSAGAAGEFVRGAVISAGEAAAKAAASDERLKKNITSADKDIEKFLKKLSAKKYEYKTDKYPGTDKEVHIGIMAQDLEKSKAGKDMVEKDENGIRNVVADAKGFTTVLAALASLNKKMEELQKNKSKK